MALSVVQSAIILSEESLVTAKTAFGPGAAFTVGSGGNRALLFAIYAMDGGSASATSAPTITATFNGASVSILAGTYRYHSGDRVWQVLGYLPAPPSGAGTLSVTASSGQWSMWAIAAELTDAHQTTMPARLSSNTLTSGTSQTASGTTTVNGSMLFGAIGIGKRTGNPSTAISVTDGTSDGDGQTGTTDLKSLVAALAHKAVPTAGAASVAFSWTGSARFGWQTVEVFEQVASGGGQTTTADALTLSLTLGDAALTTARTISAAALALSLTLGDAALTAGRTIAAEALALSLTLGDAVLSTGVTQPLSITELPYDGYVFGTINNATATVTLTGKGTTGQQVQVRGASVGGNTAWQTAVVDAAGNWSVTWAQSLAGMPAQWWTIEARYGTDDLTKITATNQFGCGKKVKITGQSELVYFLSPNSFYSSAYTFPAQLATNLTTLTQEDDTVGGAIVKRKVTSYVAGQVNVGLAALANALHFKMPGWKFEIIDGAVAGTNINQMFDDGNAGRNWQPYADIEALATSGGSELDLDIWCWWNSPADSIKTFGQDWAGQLMGQRWSGAAQVLGTANPESPNYSGSIVSHCLYDVEVASNLKGRGIRSRDRTKIALVEPMPFHDTPTTEMLNYSDGGGRITQLDRPARSYLRDTFLTDARVQSFTVAGGFSAHLVDFNGGIHPRTDDAFGVPQMAMQFLPVILTACGVNVQQGKVTGNASGAGGAHADLIVSLPNDGTLTTVRAIKAMAAPSPEPPHYQPVIGVEIRRAADTDAQRRPVFKTTETTYPANYRGTTAVADSGTGTGAGRTGRLRITPVNAFVSGDGLELLRGQVAGHLLEPRDVTARLVLDMPVEHIPALYDATQPYPFYGVPIQPQPSLQVLTVTPGQTISPEALSLTISLGDARLTAGRTIAAEALSLTMTLGDAALATARTTTAEALVLSIALGDARLVAGRTIASDALALTITLGDASIANAAAPASSARWATPEDSETTGTFGEYRT